MTKHTARLLREVKKGCSYRRLAEIYHSKRNPLYGVQMEGSDLCIQAFKILYPNLGHPFEIGYGPDADLICRDFLKDNKSYIGDFFWWE